MSCHAHALARSRRMLCEEDVDLIREIVSTLPSGSLVVDVGAGSGTAALAVFSQRSDMRVLSIDSDDNLNWTQQALENAALAPLSQWTRVEGSSAESARVVDEGVELVILDASHDYDGVTADLAAWLPKVVPGGAVIVHDYDARTAPNLYPGVKQAVDHFVDAGNAVFSQRQGWSALLRTPTDQRAEGPSSAPDESPEKPKRKRTRKRN